MTRNGTRHCHRIGLQRRELLQIGYSGLLGAGVSSILAQRAEGNGVGGRSDSPRAKSVILIFLTGAPSHLDTFDLKPDAPVEVRGEFQSIATATMGYRICEHLPQLAARSDKYAIIRSMTHGLPSHEHATHMLLTGIDKMPIGATHMASRFDWPCYASALDFVRPRNDGVPNGVMLPRLNNGVSLGRMPGPVRATRGITSRSQRPEKPRRELACRGMTAMRNRRQFLSKATACLTVPALCEFNSIKKGDSI
jgi:hypothetical protein